MLELNRYFLELESETVRLANLAHEADGQLPIPTCPDWTLEQMVEHVGRGHRWAAEIIRRRLPEPIAMQEVVVPADPDERSEWLTAGARMLADAVRVVGAQQPVWTWQRDRSAGFWLRRLLHDEVVHRFDAELALGATGDLAADLAADGVSDVLDTAAALSRPDIGVPSPFAGLVGAGESLQFIATDTDLGSSGEWSIIRSPAGVTWRHGHETAHVTVRGPALQLLLLLNRRLPVETADVEISGDRKIFAHWWSNSRF
ncbi:maleylpyruvate isomerase family mycothiol-dependent enzyme [Actinoplanes hulinensis]|uniref:Maleylpyruvate isomerase family mycothiol-dependent enzyme n=1 Tax=Actinoplanes hulinensis TaxID=1144547 RepID=A0ABS7AXL1_9ACTN|nr:maleylpyruvate isomerase family mycothiol-dependent enzyme [Actinoplanes hulinensis]MBW6433470.1 maleylpyruvate isomerase family mycothiol-dependent enzyme [Actinoplanes hulinensis]